MNFLEQNKEKLNLTDSQLSDITVKYICDKNILDKLEKINLYYFKIIIDELYPTTPMRTNESLFNLFDKLIDIFRF